LFRSHIRVWHSNDTWTKMLHKYNFFKHIAYDIIHFKQNNTKCNLFYFTERY